MTAAYACVDVGFRGGLGTCRSKLRISVTVVRRIFAVQIGLVVTILLLLLVGDWCDVKRFGFDFWFAFTAGPHGGQHFAPDTERSGPQSLQEAGRSMIFDTMMPILYGAIMAGLTYLLFMSGILSGAPVGLLTTNLFPTFDVHLVDLKTKGVVKSFLGSRPATLPDLENSWRGVLAGYSEKFVIGILGKLATPDGCGRLR